MVTPPVGDQDVLPVNRRNGNSAPKMIKGLPQRNRRTSFSRATSAIQGAFVKSIRSEKETKNEERKKTLKNATVKIHVTILWASVTVRVYVCTQHPVYQTIFGILLIDPKAFCNELGTQV